MSYFSKRKSRKTPEFDSKSLVDTYLSSGGQIASGTQYGESKEYDQQLTRFYRSDEWITKREEMKALLPPICVYCDSTADLVVDHIKPLRYYWHLRLDNTNFQMLCKTCNKKKGDQIEPTDVSKKTAGVLIRIRRNRLL